MTFGTLSTRRRWLTLPLFTVALVGLFGALVALLPPESRPAAAFSTGRITVSRTGCSCHSVTPDANGDVTVSLVGPTLVAPGSTSAYTVSVSGGPPAGGGLNVSPSGGQLMAGPNTQLLSGEITHRTPNSRSWSFSWVAPSASGVFTIYAAAQAVNLSGDNTGDSWDFASPLAISVSALQERVYLPLLVKEHAAGW